jgi:peroxiredoxin
LNPGADSRGFEGAIIRSVFVVDRDATIRYRFVSEDPARLPDIEEVLTAARSVVASG